MNQTQTVSSVGAMAAFIAGILSTKLPIFDQATWLIIVTGLITMGGAVIGYLTRDKALINQVGNLDGTLVVTKPEIAAALPNNTSVLPSDEVKVSEIKK